MASQPLVSVVTPTWNRHDLLLTRCMDSVAAQTYPNVEHVIVSDGPDNELVTKMAGAGPRVVFDWLPVHSETARWGHFARLRALELAKGKYIAYLDDDNAFRPQHVGGLVAALEAVPEAGFAYSMIQMQGSAMSPYVVGVNPPSCGGIDTSAIMHRAGLTEIATWRDEGQQTVDWDLVERWIHAGVQWVYVADISADYYFG